MNVAFTIHDSTIRFCIHAYLYYYMAVLKFSNHASICTDNICNGSSAYWAFEPLSLHLQSTGHAHTQVSTAVDHRVYTGLRAYHTAARLDHMSIRGLLHASAIVSTITCNWNPDNSVLKWLMQDTCKHCLISYCNLTISDTIDQHTRNWNGNGTCSTLWSTECSQGSSHFLPDGPLDVQLQVKAHPHHLLQLLELGLHLCNLLTQFNNGGSRGFFGIIVPSERIR